MSTPKVRVVIVGGGISGLTLANALEQGNIDYVLLEGRDIIAPEVGASIGITYNGGRILDQLGCYDEIERTTKPFDDILTWHEGRLINVYPFPRVSMKRTGYGFAFVDRRQILLNLHGNIKNKTRVLTGKRVSRVDHSTGGITVQCKDGTTYSGDIVVGADGVHSMVRHEMWRHMNLTEPGLLGDDATKTMSASYNCVYGISRPLEGFKTGPLNQVVAKEISSLHTTALDGRIWWFIFSKLDKTYYPPNIPQYTKEDAEALAEKACSILITNTVKFKELWENRISYTLVPLEEAFFENWTWGRFACIGDSIHKWTPNIGQGGNNAIESAAAIANTVHELQSKSKTIPPSYADVSKALTNYHKCRKARALEFSIAAKRVTRLEAFSGRIAQLFILYVYPRPQLKQFLLNKQVNISIGSEKINFLADTERSYRGHMAFNQNYGVGHKPSILRRALVAAPFLAILYFFHICFTTILDSPTLQHQLTGFISSGRIDFGSGTVWTIPQLPDPFPLLAALFSPGLLGVDNVQRLQSLTFLVDISPLWLVVLLESFRVANFMKFCYFTTAFGIAAQLRGIGVAGPIFFFLHYVQSPPDHFVTWDWRLIDTAAAKTALAAILIPFTIPTVLMYTWPDLQKRIPLSLFWQIWPITVNVFHYILRKTVVADTIEDDKLYNVKADLPSVRTAVKILALVSATTFNYVRLFSPISFMDLLLPDWLASFSLHSNNPVQLDVTSGMHLFLQLDWLSFTVTSFLWLGLLIKDIKNVEMVRTSWIKIILIVVLGITVAGPGATLALSWLWREEILATKRAKGAVVRPEGQTQQTQVKA